MLHSPKNVAPEPYFSAAVLLLHHVVLHIRMGLMSKEQVIDLADAVHNVPESLVEYGRSFDERSIREHYLKAYDMKWATDKDDVSLIQTLDGAIDRVKGWLADERR